MTELVTGRLGTVFYKAENENIPGQVHSVFNDVINIELFLHGGEKRIVTLIPPGFPGLPDSIVVSRDCCRKIAKFAKCNIIKIEKKKDTISFGEAGPMLILKNCIKEKAAPDGAYTCRFDKHKAVIFLDEYHLFVKKKEKKDGISELPEKYADGLKKFVDGFFTNDPYKIKTSFQLLAGAGKGLTPSCDDAMTGALSLLYAFYISGQIPGRTKQYLENVAPLKKILLTEKRTTDISCKYLKCACEGHFSEPLLKISDWFFGNIGEDLQSLFETVASAGHSSGLDMLAGIKSAAEALIHL